MKFQQLNTPVIPQTNRETHLFIGLGHLAGSQLHLILQILYPCLQSLNLHSVRSVANCLAQLVLQAVDLSSQLPQSTVLVPILHLMLPQLTHFVIQFADFSILSNMKNMKSRMHR